MAVAASIFEYVGGVEIGKDRVEIEEHLEIVVRCKYVDRAIGVAPGSRL